jgi:nucleoid-associated protein YgaU
MVRHATGRWSGSTATNPSTNRGTGRPLRERQVELEAALLEAEAAVESEAAPAGATPPAQLTYRVRPGDTLTALATAFSDEPSYLEQLLSANPQLDDPDLLLVGQPLSVPTPGSGD